MSAPYDTEAVGLYVHVPYCASLCGYCDFYRVASPEGVPPEFDSLLLAEAREYHRRPALGLDSVFLGGGTPSLLGADRLARLLEGLRGLFAFAEGAEITLEANPETVSAEALAGWRAAGVTRLSIGVQSLSPDLLATLDRRASAEVALRAVKQAADAGFTHLSADCMSGVPGQRPQDLVATLEALADLPIDHLSVYSLDLHQGTRLWEAVLRGNARLPDEDEAADLYLLVHDLLAEREFEHYEVSNFARPGGRCRHNLRYWLGGETIGLGPSAWSHFQGRLYGNPRSTETWAGSIRAGSPPHVTSEELTGERRREDRVIFGLRLREGAEMMDVRGLIGEDGRSADAVLDPLLQHGYAQVDGDRLRLTAIGFLMSNEVLTYLLPGKWPRGGKR